MFNSVEFCALVWIAFFFCYLHSFNVSPTSEKVEGKPSCEGYLMLFADL